ncbi:pyridoxamine 5'-phosphate oxidase [Pedobacter riviphilus]|uniref:Pyridoxine/pyridoxamine 5'-phosphate oxidase n=1 Tax=Pedobacter riviphilus TaxID=2766984 RepID=A0ABX6TL44_9SPHI|nr:MULTISPECIES: pyridoxamine 5'-phosphate oxidase [Pedobacter]NII82498.1 pyridoxamine 5'-phosphate oxidase [Pedobacter sp. SG908]NMN36523.1 pyridoxamine 5'-phosphate oxidase [Pedobacter sp. SG918]QNR86253.1 pyridoxamine 5'-phosphate oxidase [Pedobacter riviphilus]
MQVTNEFLQNLRQDYKSASLDESDVDQDPIIQFKNWFQHAIDAQIYEPNVMTLATADKAGRPDARIVLLKGVDTDGFRFFTNYLSAKGKELKRNPYAALVFFWPELERQVRIEGTVEKLDKETSEEYFNTRPVDSQIGAVASPQSQVIPNRAFLEEKVEELKAKSANKGIAKPAHWGGYIVKPTRIEFWQGRSSRLHDRINFEKVKGIWTKTRLAP